MIQLKNHKSETFKTTFPDAVGEIISVRISPKALVDEDVTPPQKVYRSTVVVQVFADETSLKDGGSNVDAINHTVALADKDRKTIISILEKYI